jgi:hypothetical protein
MTLLRLSDRIVWEGKKGVVKRLWKNKVRIILSDLSEETVAIAEVEPWINTPNGQTSLIDTSRYESKRDFRDWELENQDVIETGKVSITKCFDNNVSITMDETDVIETSQPENVIETSNPENVIETSQPENVIETSEDEDDRLGLNPYWVQRRGKKYEYWRFTYREGSKVKHHHIGNSEKASQYQGKKRQEILSLLKGGS